MASITASLTKRPGEDAKVLIGKTMLRENFDAADLPFFERYFTYYEKELGLLSLGKMSNVLNKMPQAATTHADILKIVDILRAKQDSTKLDLRQHFVKEFSRADVLAIERSIELASRLWTMVNVRHPKLEHFAPQTDPVLWELTGTMRSLFSQAIPRSRWKIGVKDSRLHPSFTAAFMTDICGLQLEWTDCLADHLRLDRRQKALRIYPYKSVLQCHLEEARSHTANRPAYVLFLAPHVLCQS